jgi:hypothetical protein
MEREEERRKKKRGGAVEGKRHLQLGRERIRRSDRDER